MSKNSWRHHYIPEFYLKNFTLDNNKFYVYLTQEERYNNNGHLFSPKQSFYEKNGNTLILKNETFDFIENEFYRNIDNDVAKIFQNIKESKNGDYGLTNKDYAHLELFVAHLFWRNPLNDKYIIDLFKIKGIKGFGFKFKNKKTKNNVENSDIEKEMNKNGTTYKMLKYFVPLFLYENVLKNNSSLKIIQFETGNKPSLISDNPIIFKKAQGIDIYKDDFILPIDSNKILVRGNKFKSHFKNQTIFEIDYLLMKQANKYVSTTDMKYIPLLEKMGEAYSVSELKKNIFSNFIE